MGTQETGRTRISSGSPYEPVVGYSRALVAGRHVFVSGTAPIMPNGADPPPDAYGQANRCLEIIGDALAQVGASFVDVVRTRMYLTAADAFDGAGRAHGEVFGAIRPANTTVIVAGLLDPRWLLEIEVQALLPPSA
jgi:enamine deaminase RidA (YjgF/YER057c/UK114 family)